MSNLSVLVVEDNETDMAVITGALDASGISYLAVSNSKEAVEAAIRFNPRIALLDMNMPHLDGRELSELLQTNPLTSHIKIIFLTASENIDDVLFGVKVHASAYFRKGVPMRDLLDSIVSIDFATALREDVNEFHAFNKTLSAKYENICARHH